MPRHNAFTRSEYRQFSCRRNHRHRDSQRYSSWRILPGNSSSDGSLIEAALHELMDRKAEQTVEFFSHIYGKAPNADAIRLLMGSQFWYFRQLLDQHMEEDGMLTCLQAVLDFTNAGWRQLCDTLQQIRKVDSDGPSVRFLWPSGTAEGPQRLCAVQRRGTAHLHSLGMGHGHRYFFP